MPAKTKTFPTSVIVSAVLGPRCCDMVDIMNFYEFMAGKSMDSALVMIRNLCLPNLMEQLPWLKGIDISIPNRSNWHDWIIMIEAKYGRAHQVTSLLPN